MSTTTDKRPLRLCGSNIASKEKPIQTNGSFVDFMLFQLGLRVNKEILTYILNFLEEFTVSHANQTNANY